jgi:ParB-like nuclease domain
MTLVIKPIKPSQEYASLFPELSIEEYESLKQSIKQKGLTFLKKYPIIVNDQGVILDGYHRYRACRELGLESKLDLDADVNRQGKSHIQLADRVEFNRGDWVSPFKDGDKIQEILFIVNSNLRHSGTTRSLLVKNKFQRVELAIKIRSILEKIAEAEYMSLVGLERGTKQIYISPYKKDEELGKLAGVGKETVRNAKIIIQNATEEIKQQVRTGQTSMNKAINDILEQRINALKKTHVEQNR